MPTVSELAIYPVKSCGVLHPEQAELDARGFRDDRRWMIVRDTPNARGQFVTLREYPPMALIQPSLQIDTITLDMPGYSALTLPRDLDGPRISVEVWNDTCSAIDMGDGAAAWVSRALGVDLRLVRQADDEQRAVSMKYTNEASEVSFADGYPLLIISTASLDDLNDRLLAKGADALPMGRFRPNIVVTGVPAFAEDTWKRIRIGGIEMEVAKPCARCVATTVDPATGTVPDSDEPLRTLATFRRGVGGGVMFGQNVIHRGLGHINVGDTVEVLTYA